MPNRLTLLYSRVYYKKENYLKVKTTVFKYITPLYSKGWVYWYVSILSQSKVQSTSTLNNWARYVDKINRQD